MNDYPIGGMFNQDPTDWIDKYTPNTKKELEAEKEYDYIENGKKKKHTPRQWKLYEFFKTHDLKDMTQEEIIEMYEEYILGLWAWNNVNRMSTYSYCYHKEKNDYPEKPFSNMSSAREYRKDKQALQKSETITAVITKYGIARTKEDAREYLDKTLIDILKRLKRYHIQNKHYGNDGQIRLVFNNEKEIIEAIKELEE